MADAKSRRNIPKQSLIYGALCLAGILIFVVVGIVPAGRTLANLDTQIADAKYKLAEQNALRPLFQILEGENAKKESQILPLPQKGKLSQSQIGTIPATVRKAAQMSGMTMLSAMPNLNALTGDASLLSVSIVLKGEFKHFRKFLLEIGGLPYVQHVEEIAIQGKSDMKEFRLKIWLAVG